MAEVMADVNDKEFNARIRRDLERELGPEKAREMREAEEAGKKFGQSVGKGVETLGKIAEKGFPVMKIPESAR
jgi:hypothetical protein